MLSEDSNWQDIIDAINSDDLESAQMVLEDICDNYNVEPALADELTDDIEDGDVDQFMEDAGVA